METVYYCPMCGKKLEESYNYMKRNEMTGKGRLYCPNCKCNRVDIRVYFTEGEVKDYWQYVDKGVL